LTAAANLGSRIPPRKGVAARRHYLQPLVTPSKSPDDVQDTAD
jgi:hypothetical protein